MKVMTWNILSSIWLDQREYRGMQVRLGHRMSRVSARIKHHRPDLVALQEVSTRELPYLQKQLGRQYHFSKLIAHGCGHWKGQLRPGAKYVRNGNLILFAKRYFKEAPKVKGVKLSLDGNYGAFVPSLGLLAVHFDDTSRSLRNEQLRTALKLPGVRVIMGDFNATPEEYLHRRLRALGWESDYAGISYPFEPQGLIDFIYVFSLSARGYMLDDYLINYYNSVRNDEETMAKYGSDHYPILVDLDIDAVSV